MWRITFLRMFGRRKARVSIRDRLRLVVFRDRWLW